MDVLHRFHYILLLLSGLGFAIGTLELILSSLLVPHVMRQWPNVTNSQVSLLLSMTLVGEIVGGFGWAQLADRKGRRIVFVAAMFAVFAFSALCAIADSFVALIALRTVLGMALGGTLAIDIIFFIEFIPVRNSMKKRTNGGLSRDQITCVIILFGIFGMMLISLFALTLEAYGWRVYLVVCSVPSGILAIARASWVRWDTPAWLISKGQYDQAEQVIDVMHKMNAKDTGNDQSIDQSTQEDDFAIVSDETNSLVRDSSTIIADQPSSFPIAKTAFLSVTWFCVTFAYYSLTFWLRSFSRYIAERNGRDPNAKPLLPDHLMFLVVGAAELPGLAVTTWLIGSNTNKGIAVSNVGKIVPIMNRPWVVLLGNLIGCAIFCGGLQAAAIGSSGNRLIVLLVNCGIYFFIVGCWSILYIFTPQIFPSNVRSVGMAVASLTGKIGAIVAPPAIGAFWDSSGSVREYVIALPILSFLIAVASTAFIAFSKLTKNS